MARSCMLIKNSTVLLEDKCDYKFKYSGTPYSCSNCYIIFTTHRRQRLKCSELFGRFAVNSLVIAT